MRERREEKRKEKGMKDCFFGNSVKRMSPDITNESLDLK